MMKPYTGIRVEPRVHDELLQYADDLKLKYNRRVTASDAIEILLQKYRGIKEPLPTGKRLRRGPGRPPKFYGDEERTPRDGMRAMRKMREAQKE